MSGRVLFTTLFVIIAVSNFNRVLFAQDNKPSGEITGVVREQKSHKPLLGVNVIVMGLLKGAATDENGAFVIPNIPPGIYTVKASMVGYVTQVKTDVVVAPSRQTRLVFEMAEAVLELGEVTVTADYFSRRQEFSTSAHALNYEEIRRSPGAAEDISRVVQSIPGVVVGNDLRNDLIVRGGSPAENLFLVDNIEIPNINHFATQGASGGPIGMVNTEFIREVDFLSGGFPARYGDKLSAVMEIDLREGDRSRLSGVFDVNAAGVALIGEGPLGSDGSWMFSARRSYLDFLFKYFGFAGITVIPNYVDFQGKVVLNPGPSDKLSFLAIGGIDDVSFDDAKNQNFGANPDLSGIEFVDNDQYQYVVGGTWKRLWGNTGYSLLTFSHNLNYFYTNVDDTAGEKSYFNESVEREYPLKFDASFQADDKSTVEFGAGGKFIDLRHNVFIHADTSRWANRETGTGIFPELAFDKRVRSYKLWAYAQYGRRLFNRLLVTPGLRLDYFEYVDHGFTVSPRLTSRYYFTDRTSINLATGIFYQTPAYTWLTTDDRNRALKPLRADHLIAGFEHLLRDDFLLTVDVFLKKYSNYPVSGFIPSYILVNGGTSYGAFIAGDLRSEGTGTVKGVELFLQKKMTGTWYGTLSYSYSVSRFVAGDKVERPGNYDYGHVFTIIFGYRVSPFLEISCKWRYAGGAPYTPINEPLSRFFGREVMDLSRINAERYPPYHRLDVRVDYRFALGGLDVVTYLDLENAYNRKNIYTYVWNTREQKPVPIYQWSILPVFGLKVNM